MTEAEIYNAMEQELFELARKYSITRAKISTINFDRDYKLGQDGNLHLVSTKAVVKVLGKVTKVPIGENERHKTFESAFEATKKYWSEYYKKIRASRSEAQQIAESKRQKRYRERRKQNETDLKRQQ